jgi:hypothetical protein
MQYLSSVVTHQMAVDAVTIEYAEIPIILGASKTFDHFEEVLVLLSVDLIVFLAWPAYSAVF